jgi:hypothetical protein
MPHCLAVVIGMLLSLGLISCDLFETRTAGDPIKPSSNYVPPKEPSLVFQNMVNAFHDMNAFNYASSFADSSNSNYTFTFEPTSQARSRYPDFAEWTKQSELKYFENIQSKLKSGTTPLLEFLTLTQQGVATDPIQYDATYQLTIQHVQPNIPSVAKGRAQFFLIADKSRNWVIRHWIDIEQNQNDFTWSELKGAFALINN